MDIVNTHNHRLIFRIDNDAPEEYMKIWKEFKLKCENGDNKHVVEQIKSYCKLEKNKTMPYLNRSEGGMGGGDNILHKQLRFRDDMHGMSSSICADNDIMFSEIMNTEHEKWTYEELDDIIYAFTKTANYHVKTDCVSGYIELKHTDTETDDYLDSDSE